MTFCNLSFKYLDSLNRVNHSFCVFISKRFNCLGDCVLICRNCYCGELQQLPILHNVTTRCSIRLCKVRNKSNRNRIEHSCLIAMISKIYKFCFLTCFRWICRKFFNRREVNITINRAVLYSPIFRDSKWVFVVIVKS